MRAHCTALGVASVSVISTLSLLSASCAEVSGPEPRLAIDIAPLRLEGITDATWRLTVTTPASATPVWQRALTSSDYGDGRGSATYVGPCDASPGANPNRISLELLELRDADGALADPLDFKNPAPAGSPVFVERDCLPNTDAAVTFDLTVMRRAEQGFFDVAVNFEDLFCSAKIDCEREGGQTLDLLFDPTTGERVPTVVMTLACTGGPAADTHLWLDRPLLTCGAGPALPLPIDGDEPGQVFTANPEGPIRQLATYRGRESLSGPGGVSWSKLYANVALALDPGQSCSLTAVASASDGPLEALTTPSGAYPLIRWNIAALTDTTRPVCGRRPLDEANAPAGTGTFTSYTSGGAKTFEFGLASDPASTSRLVVLRGAGVCGDTTCDGAETAASCPEDCVAVCPVGSWGPRCDRACVGPGCASGLACDRTTGVATACSACATGSWGAACESACINPEGCSGTPTCERETGAVASCEACLPGFFGPTCESDWWDETFARRSDVTLAATFVPDGATHVQVAIDVDTICYGTKLPNLLYAYHFDEAAGTTLESREGHGGFATLGNGGSFQPGVEGTALRLNGSSQWVDLPDLVPTTHTMTLAAWFRPSALPANNPAIVSAWGTAGQSGGEVYLMTLANASQCAGGGTGVKLLQKVHPVGQAEHGKCTASLAANQWYFAALTYNGRIERGYLDGVEQTFHDYGAVSTLEPSSTLRLGLSRDLSSHFPGDVDSVMLFDGYLDETDLAALRAPKCRRDLADLRLVDPTTGATYPHWRESDHRIVARVPVAALARTLHLYHGNPNAPSTSSGASTFEHFEGFEGGALQSGGTLASGCSGTGPLPSLIQGRLAASGNCGVLSSSTSFGTGLLDVAVDVMKPTTSGETLTCVDARLGWANVNVLGSLSFDFNEPGFGLVDRVGIGAAHECNMTTGLVGAFNIGTFELTQIPNGIYVSRYTAVDARAVEGPLPFQFPAGKGALALHAAGTTNAPRYFDNLRVSVAADVSATLGPPCTPGTCATYRWVDLGPRTEPMRTASCTNGSGTSATCNGANLGRRVHVDTTAGASLQFRAVSSTALDGSMPGGAAFAATLSPDGTTLDMTGRGSGCTGLTTSLVTLEHVYECQLVP